MNLYSCEPCKETFYNFKYYEFHLQSEKHQKTVIGSTSIVQDFKNCNWLSDWKKEPSIRTFKEPSIGLRYECTICKIYLNSVSQVRTHIAGAKHKKVKDNLSFEELAELSSGNRSIDQVDNNSPSTSHIGGSTMEFYNHIDGAISSDWENDWKKEPSIRTFKEPIGLRYECTICKIYLNSVSQVRTHIAGAKHKKVKNNLSFEELAELSSGNRSIDQMVDDPQSLVNRDSPLKLQKHNDEVNPEDWEKEPFIIWVGKEYKCTICKTYLNSGDQVRGHVKGAKHLKVKRNIDPTDLNEFSSGSQSPAQDGNTPASFHDGDSPFKFDEQFGEFKKLIENIKVFKPDDEIVFSLAA